MRELIEKKTVVADAHHDYVYSKEGKTPIPDDGVCYLYLSEKGMLKATEYEDRAGSVEGKFIKTDEVTAKDGKPCVNGKVYDIWDIGENFVVISARGDKFYITDTDTKKIVYTNKDDIAAYTLLHSFYKMLI